MKLLKSYFLLITFFHLCLEGINRNQLPNPQLESTIIEWWFPTNLPPKLHMTLRYFEIGNVWENFSHKTIEEKRHIRKLYPRLKAELINAKDELLKKTHFTHLFSKELEHDETYTLTGIDIIGTHPDFYDEYALDTSQNYPGGIPKKIKRLKNIFEHGDPYESEEIKTKQGKKIVPRYKWYLVAKLDNNIINFRNKLALNPLFNKFTLNTTAYLPHITLGKIKNIKKFDQFISAIANTNLRISKEPKDKKSLRLQDIERLHPNEHKVYLLLDKTRKSNMIFLLVIGWVTPLGKLLKNIVYRFKEEEPKIRENVFANHNQSNNILL